MAEILWETRYAEDEPLFKQPTDDPTIRSDTVTPAVEGYFRIPAVWIGEKPDDASVLKLSPQIHHEIVVKKELCSGIEVRVQRDGTFLFNFSSWKHAPQIMIPGYRTPGPQMPHRPPKETADASEKSEKYAVLRAQVMNVHQSCLATSERLIKRRSSQVGLPLTAADTLKGLTFGACITYRDSMDAQTLVRNALNNKEGITRQHPFLRHVLEIEVIAHSLDLLDQILLAEDTDLIQMIEAAYMAACRCAEGRLGEAVTLAWGVCEQLLSTAWETLLNDTRDTGRMPARRRKKLKDRDYTASVITEMLELGMRIDHDLYRHLEEARKSRNQWTHDMCEPSIGQVRDAIRAAEGLFRQIKGIHLSFQLSGPSPGVPEWNIWIWEASKGSDGS